MNIKIAEIKKKDGYWVIRPEQWGSTPLTCPLKIGNNLKKGDAIKVWIGAKGAITHIEKIPDNKFRRIPKLP